MKVVIIGLGSIAQKHIKALFSLGLSIEIYALRHSRNSQHVEGIIDIYSMDEILILNPDFIIVSNPTLQHFQTIRELIKFKIPLFIEKPLFSNIGKQEKELVDTIVNQNITTYVACNLRFHKGLIEMKRILQEKQIQEVNSYCGSFLPEWRPGVNFREVYSAKAELGGGVHIDLIHELDYLYWIFGEPRNTSHVFTSNSSLNISSVDYANYLWEYDGFCANVVLNYYRRDAKRTFEVLTTEGTYLLDLLKNQIYYQGEMIFSSEQKPEDMYFSQMRYFIEEILKKGSKFNTIDEANKVLELCMQD
ncbi:Gfo/Idh/MocA family protein [Capnocytophaga stomatis]|uniref:Gfo/Idh/MocA family protein n=1 Tax=Capnocytophaga stomatis TaxID=1848904 RepID=UPI00385B492B